MWYYLPSCWWRAGAGGTAAGDVPRRAAAVSADAAQEGTRAGRETYAAQELTGTALQHTT